jgi:hypothetical protein
MSLFGSLLPGNFRLKRTLFRRDAENSFYSNKPFPIPLYKDISDDTIINYKNSYPYNFIKNSSGLKEIRDILLTLEDLAEITNKAELAFNNVFDLPCKDNIYAGKKFRWNYDYVSGYEWSKDLSWRGDLLNFPEGTDIVNAWLPGRLNELIYFGKGYLATEDEKYVQAYINHLDDFTEGNPFCTGVNWLDVGEVSIRLLNIIFSLPMVIFSEYITAEFINKLNKQILLHSIFIENNFEESDRGYSYIISLAALSASGILFKDNEFGKKLIRLSYSLAEESMRKLVTSDGITSVRSTAYHPHIVEAYIIIKHSLELAGIKVSELFTDRYSRMFSVLASFIRDDHSISVIGDAFIRRILPFSSYNNRFPLSIGCVEFSKGSFKHFLSSPPADLLFYKGADAVNMFNSIESVPYRRISHGYMNSGIFILRNNDIHITVDAAEVGSGKRKTRGHNDVLSFELFYKDKPVIVDPGAYSFYADKSIRYQQRTVKNHNTLCIDDEEPVELEGIALIKEDLSKPKITEWHSDEYEDILSVQHYAYARFADPVIIKRIFRFNKEENKLLLRDELFGGSSHKVSMSFVFHPDAIIRQEGLNRFIIKVPAALDITFLPPADNYLCTIENALYSPTYGKLFNTKKIVVYFTARLPVYTETEITLK